MFFNFSDEEITAYHEHDLSRCSASRKQYQGQGQLA